MTLNTYNQGLNEMNGLMGLVAFVLSGGKLFRTKEGNYQLMKSALSQANEIYDASYHVVISHHKNNNEYSNIRNTSENLMELRPSRYQSLSWLHPYNKMIHR